MRGERKMSYEFSHFIGGSMRLEPVLLEREASIKHLLEYYMGKNTPDRQNFIIKNLRVEEDVLEEVLSVEV